MMGKYLIIALFVVITLTFVMAAPATNNDDAPLPVELDQTGPIPDGVDVQSEPSRKIKRGIYGGYGYGLGYGYGYYPYGFGHGYGGYYGGGYYPYYGIGYGYGHGYGHGGYGGYYF